MKDKTKKVMAGLGIGLTLAGSVMMMTGCTETPVTDAQVDKVFTALYNANKFMEETKDILNKQNEEIGNIVLERENKMSINYMKILLDYIIIRLEEFNSILIMFGII